MIIKVSASNRPDFTFKIRSKEESDVYVLTTKRVENKFVLVNEEDISVYAKKNKLNYFKDLYRGYYSQKYTATKK